ncbi:MAG: hypothetical protein GTN76_08155 [Candidatus Aenigmarchaeota archaeon]|nr:hypothetical protein [Candidatus Aenigmarchaeota archaeon]
MSEKIAGSIKRFQVVYTKSGDIRIRMVRRENYSLETEAYLRKFLEKNFDSNTKIEFVYVPEIKPQVSGKYQMVTWEKESDSLSPSSGGRRS